MNTKPLPLVVLTCLLLAACAPAVATPIPASPIIIQYGENVKQDAASDLEAEKYGSLVIIEYGNQVRSDVQKLDEAWTEAAKKNGSPDYSGNDYVACQLPEDCMSPEYSCLPGIKPNTPALPGYCVPAGEEIK